MIEFYFHYDSNTHKGLLVTIQKQDTVKHYVDRIVCDVSTSTERKEVSPKFVVKGEASSIIITDGVAYIS